MNIEDIRELIKLMKENQISEVNIESGEQKVQLKAQPVVQAGTYEFQAAPPAPTGHGAPPASDAPATEDESKIIRSPIVGVFYASPSPDKPPFVGVGDEIGENSVLCIIEAMKVMNEIKAETRGRIKRIAVENGQPVEYGQPLFILE